MTQFGPAAPDPGSGPQRAFNQALRQFGIERGDAFDEFEALGRRRHTDDWAAGSPR